MWSCVVVSHSLLLHRRIVDNLTKITRTFYLQTTDEMLWAALSICAAQLILEMCLGAPVNPCPSTMQIRLKRVWSQSHEDLFDLCWLLTKWSCYWMLSTACVYNLILLLFTLSNRICFLLAPVSFIALCSCWILHSRTLLISNNQYLSAEHAQPCSVHIWLINWFSCINVIHKGTWLTCTCHGGDSYRVLLQRMSGCLLSLIAEIAP